jgi:hypothetical protein
LVGRALRQILKPGHCKIELQQSYSRATPELHQSYSRDTPELQPGVCAAERVIGLHQPDDSV